MARPRMYVHPVNEFNMTTDPFAIEDAKRSAIRLRMMIDGPSGSGKTATSHLFATALARRYGGKIGMIATEQSRDLIYANTRFAPDGFQRIQLSGKKSIANYRAALNRFKVAGGFAVVVIDSLSHAWSGPGGLLDEVDGMEEERNEWSRWKEGGKIQNSLLSDIIEAPFHLIATVRTKTENVMTPDADRPGKMKVVRVGTKPVQRADIEYEFGIYCRMNDEHQMTIVKTDCDLIDRVEIDKPGMDFMTPIMDWLDNGVEPGTLPIAGVKKASDKTMREYLEIMMLQGHAEAEIRAGFQKKYGRWLEDSTEEMLAGRVVELRDEAIKAEQERLRRTNRNKPSAN